MLKNCKLQYLILEKDTTIAEMEFEKDMVKEAMKKLELKKDRLEEENQELKFELGEMWIELMRAYRNEKNSNMAVVVSWIFFAIVFTYLVSRIN